MGEFWARRRDLTVVGLFALLVFAPFWGKAYHIDEPLYLAAARHIVQDPFHPFDFDFNWYGSLVPYPQINNTPPIHLYLLALAWKWTGGEEWAMRALFFPFDLAAAWSLYLLAARFLKRPLVPTLIAVATPAYLINMDNLMIEKLVGASAFPCLYALVRGVDERRPGWYWVSAALCCAALATKYFSIFLLLPAVGYSLHGGVRWRRIAAYLTAAFAGLGGYFLYDHFTHRATSEAVWTVLDQAATMPWAQWSHKLRSLAAFIGGCGVVTAVWPFCVFRRKPWVSASLAAGGLLLFAPLFDIVPGLTGTDRWTGIAMSCGALWGLGGMFGRGRQTRGWALWAPWTLSVLIVTGCLYWSILARLILFLIPPVIFFMAEIMETEWTPAASTRFQWASLSGVLTLSLLLAAVDYRYAWAQRAVAKDLIAPAVARGRRVWFAGHWGFQYYAERAGGVALALNRGGWEQVGRGDLVLVPEMNSGFVFSKRRRLGNIKTMMIDYPIPLRLISSGYDVHQAGFYSNAFGFLPYAFNREPLDRFRIIEPLDDGNAVRR